MMARVLLISAAAVVVVFSDARAMSKSELLRNCTLAFAATAEGSEEYVSADVMDFKPRFEVIHDRNGAENGDDLRNAWELLYAKEFLIEFNTERLNDTRALLDRWIVSY